MPRCTLPVKDMIEIAILTMYKNDPGADKNEYQIRSWLIGQFGTLHAPDMDDIREHLHIESEPWSRRTDTQW